MILAARAFGPEDQRRFADLSGDRNPMHLDALQARRTQAGAPVVHGVHLLLWALGAFAARGGTPPLARLKAHFDRFVYVDETVEARLLAEGEARAVLAVAAGETMMVRIILEFGKAGPDAALDVSGEPAPPLAEPRSLAFEQMEGRAGRLAFAAAPGALAEPFPHAAGWLGAERLAGIVATTNLVGMICPGLHSIFSELALETRADASAGEGLAWRVDRVDERFRLVRLAVSGGGIAGTAAALVRPPPTRQPALDELRPLVRSGEFAGAAALVVGGSRGLGELTAKLLAAGGARTIITYKVGREDAERVAAEIRVGGGDCEILAFDAGQPAAPQLAGLREAPTHAYYFATPPIFRPSRGAFDAEKYAAFTDVYVAGFRRLTEALQARRPDVSLFYPSSVAVAETPRGMAEYARAKTEGEALCVALNVELAPLHVTMHRLPRLLTDQTATSLGRPAPLANEDLPPLVRETQSWPRQG